MKDKRKGKGWGVFFFFFKEKGQRFGFT